MNNNNFKFLLCNQIFNLIANIFFSVTIISMIYSQSNSISESTFVLIIGTISATIGGLIGPIFLDKISHKNVLLFTNLISGLITLFYTIISSFNDSIIITYSTVFLINIINSFYTPARLAVVPSIVDSDKIIKANGLTLSIRQSVQTAGWALAIPLSNLLGLQYSLYCIASCFLISSILSLYIHVKNDQHKLDSSKKTYLHQIFEGFKPLKEIPDIRDMTIMDIIENFANVIWTSSYLLAFTTTVLLANETWWGYQGSAYFLGIIIGGILVTKYSHNLQHFPGRFLFISSLLVTLLTLIYTVNKSPIIAVIISFLVGPPAQIRNIIQESIIQEKVEPTILAGAFATRSVLIQLMYAVGLISFSYLADLIGLLPIYFISVIIYFIISFIPVKSSALKKTL
ncbi:TPA: MFS transporter [Streptococcus suis]|nr:MFS transporter [Streptococcus suis]HEM3680029.1 MFS transporter [Streptococcus suis]